MPSRRLVFSYLGSGDPVSAFVTQSRGTIYTLKSSCERQATAHEGTDNDELRCVAALSPRAWTGLSAAARSKPIPGWRGTAPPVHFHAADALAEPLPILTKPHPAPPPPPSHEVSHEQCPLPSPRPPVMSPRCMTSYASHTSSARPQSSLRQRQGTRVLLHSREAKTPRHAKRILRRQTKGNTCIKTVLEHR